MSAGTVIVHRSFDPMQAEMLGDVLRDAGLAARVVGTRSGASIGVGQVIVRVHIEVPAAQAGEATELLEAFLAGDGAEHLRSEGELDEEVEAEEPPPRETPRRAFMAIGVALLMPFGGAHYYARRTFTALALFGGQLLAVRLAIGGWREEVMAAALFFTLVAADAIGAVLAIGAGRRGIDRGPKVQLAIGVAMIAVGLAIGAAATASGPPGRLFRGLEDPTGDLLPISP